MAFEKTRHGGSVTAKICLKVSAESPSQSRILAEVSRRKFSRASSSSSIAGQPAASRARGSASSSPERSSKLTVAIS